MSDNDKKLATIEDFLVNNFGEDVRPSNTTKEELYAMLVHISDLLDTVDGNL